MKRYEVFDHTADVGIEAYGHDLPEAFANAALGMFSQIVDPAQVQEAGSWRVQLEADDLESLLVRWLNELLYLFDTEGMIPKRVSVTRLTETQLEATVWGDRLSHDRHKLRSEVKAATHHRVEVVRGERPRVRVILDV